MEIKHQANDGGRAAAMPQEKLDCVVRALAIATDKPYSVAHGIAASYGRKDCHRTDRFKTIEMVEDIIGPREFYNKTVNQFIKEHNSGVYFCHMSGHVFVVKNGVIHDTSLIGKHCRIGWYAKV
jgi:hypothetical protein